LPITDAGKGWGARNRRHQCEHDVGNLHAQVGTSREMGKIPTSKVQLSLACAGWVGRACSFSHCRSNKHLVDSHTSKIT
jgi:hypothetical protein